MFGGASRIEPITGVLFVCGGTQGVGGDGRAEFALPPLSAGLAGVSIQLQGFAYDPSATGSLVLSNALTMTIAP